MCSPSVPNVPNPTNVANQQQNQYNIPSAIGQQATSNYGQTNPYGSVGFNQTGIDPATGMPIYTASQNPSGPEAGIIGGNLAGQYNVAQNVPNILGNTYSQPPNLLGGTNSLTNQWMAQYLGANQPWLNNQASQLDTQLRNQGIEPGNTSGSPGAASTAYDQQMNQLRQSQTMGIYGAEAAFQPQAFGEASTAEQLPLGLAMEAAQYGQMPGGVLPGQFGVAGAQNTLQPADYTGAVNSANQANMAAYQAKMGYNSAIIAGLAGAAGNVGRGFAQCDRALKEDFREVDAEQVLEKIAGLEVVDFAYKKEVRERFDLPERRVGPMAQDYQRAFTGDGKTIDIADLLGNILLGIQALEKRTRYLKEA